jgi:hypothetical protein
MLKFFLLWGLVTTIACIFANWLLEGYDPISGFFIAFIIGLLVHVPFYGLYMRFLLGDE